MPYNVTNYLAEQQAAINKLIAKAYGQPDVGLVTNYAFGEFVTAELFNLRQREVEGLVAYLEDQRRDDRTRALNAELELLGRITDYKDETKPVLHAFTGTNWILAAVTGTLSGTLLAVNAGKVIIEGEYHDFSALPYSVELTATPRVLVAHRDGSLTAELPAYAASSTALIVGDWNGTVYTPRTAELVIAHQTEFTNAVVMGSSLTVAGALTAASLSLSGNAAVGGNATIDGTLAVGSDFTVGDPATFGVDAETGDVAVGRNLSVAGSTTIEGNLTVKGTTFTVTSSELTVADRLIHLNHTTGTEVPAPTLLAGIAIDRGASAGVKRQSAGFTWDEAAGRFQLTFLNDAEVAVDKLSLTLKDLNAESATITNGSAIGNLDASKLTAGTVDVARLPVATTTQVGVVRPDGVTVKVDANGVLSGAPQGAIAKLGAQGDLSAASNTTVDAVIVKGARTISQVRISSLATPGSGSITVDLLKQTDPVSPATTLYTTTTNRPNLIANGGLNWVAAINPDVLTLADNEALILRIVTASAGFDNVTVEVY